LQNQLKVAQAIKDRYLAKLGVKYKIECKQTPLGKPVRGRVEFAAYRHDERQLLLNSQSMELLSRTKLVGTVTHELTHAYQHWVADQCLALENPDFDAAMTFYLNFDLYIPEAEGMTEYEKQPVEAHAIAVQAAIDKLCA
jgi:hypothetical protein